MAFLYASNLDPFGRVDQIEIMLDNGTTAILRQGHYYDLTVNELQRARQYAVFTSSSTPADEAPVGIVRLEIRGNPSEGQVPVWNASEGVFVPATISGGGGAPTATSDTFENYKIILLAAGNQVKAIPASTPTPTVPGTPTVDIKLAAVTVSWAPSSAGVNLQYVLLKNGGQIALVNGTTYRDLAVTPGSTYSYRVQAVDQYGQRSPLSPPVSAFVDPALNVAPVANVKFWPAVLPSSGKALVRLNAVDQDGQTLTLVANATGGTLTPTADVSIWTLTVP